MPSRKGSSKGGERTVSLVLEVTDKGEVKLKKFRDNTKALGDEMKRQKKNSEEFAEANRGLGDSMTFAFVKAQVLIGLLKFGFSVAVKSAIAPVKLLASSITAIGKNVIRATQEFNKFKITLEGALKSAERSRQISGFVQEFALQTPVQVRDLQDLTKSIALIPALRPTFFGDFDEVKKDLSDLYNTVIGLNSLNPQQGIPGAVFALREALTGQFRSLRARFDVMPQIVAGAIDKTVAELKRSPKLVIRALKEFVDQSVGEETIRKLGEAPKIRLENISEAIFDIAPRQIGENGFQSLISDLLGALDDGFQDFFGSGGKFERFYAPRFSTQLEGIFLGAFRIVNTVLGSGVQSLGEGESPLDSLASAAIDILESVNRKIADVATSFEQNRERWTVFFQSIGDAFVTGVDIFFRAVNKLPEVLPLIAGFVKGISSLSAQVVDLGSNIVGQAFGNLSDSVLKQLAPDFVRSIDRSNFLKKIGREGVTGNPEGIAGQDQTFARNIAEQIVRVGNKEFREGPLTSLFTAFEGGRFSRREIGAFSGRSTDEITSLILSAIGTERQIDSLRNFDPKTALGINKLFSDTAKPGASQTYIDAETGDRVTITKLPEFFKRLTGQDVRERRDPLEFRRQQGIINETAGRVPGEFRGSIDAIRGLGLKQQEKIIKILLDPLESAQNTFLETGEAFSTGLEKLGAGVERGIQAVQEARRLALRDVGEGIRRGRDGQLSPANQALLDRRVQGIEDDAARALEAIENERVARIKEAQRFRTIANAASLQTSLDVLSKTDPRQITRYEEALESFTDRLRISEPIIVGQGTKAFDAIKSLFLDETQNIRGADGQLPGLVKSMRDEVSKLIPTYENLQTIVKNTDILGATGFFNVDAIIRIRDASREVENFSKVLGRLGTSKLASVFLGERTREFDQAAGIAGSFGAGTQRSQLREARRRLELLQTQSQLERRVGEVISNNNVLKGFGLKVDREVEQKLKQIVEQEQLKIRVLERSVKLAEEQKDFQLELSKAKPEERNAVIERRVASLTERINELRTAVDANDGSAAKLLGIENVEAGQIAAARRIDEITESIAGLNQQITTTASTTKGGIIARIFGTDGSFSSLVDSTEGGEGIITSMGRTGTLMAESLIDSFSLAITEQKDGKLVTRLKTFTETIGDSVVELGLNTFDSLGTSISDSLKAVFTGDLDQIQSIWQNFFDNLLGLFARFISELLIKKAVLSIFGSFFGGGVDTAIGGNGKIIGIPQRLGGIVGPGAGGAIMALIGEGNTKEAIIPMKGDAIPARFGERGIEAMLPGGKPIPLTFFAQGGITPGPSTPSSLPSGMPMGDIYVINTVDPVDMVAQGLPQNATIVENQVAGSLRNQTTVHRAMNRFGR